MAVPRHACIDRLLTQWEPLELYFKDEVKGTLKAKTLTSYVKKQTKIHATVTTKSKQNKSMPLSKTQSTTTTKQNLTPSATKPVQNESDEPLSKTSASSSSTNSPMPVVKPVSLKKKSTVPLESQRKSKLSKTVPTVKPVVKKSQTAHSSSTKGKSCAQASKSPPQLQESRLTRIHSMILSPQTKL